MSDEPLISVLLANWHGGRFLDEAISSVLGQAYQHLELIAVDTGSNDESCAIIKSWAGRDSRVRPLLIAQRMCCPGALNIGLAEARGGFVARIESDDRWHADRLRAQLDFVRTRERVGVCGCDVMLIDETGCGIRMKRYPRTHAQCLRALAWRAFRVRMTQARRLGYHPPLAARVYSVCTLAAALLPPLPTRRLFEWGLRHAEGDGAISLRNRRARTSQARSQCPR